MYKAALYLFLAILCFVPTASADGAACEGEGCDPVCETMNEIMDEASKKWTTMSSDVYTQMIETPDTQSLKDCLGNIGGITGSFGLSIPSIADLVDAACTFARNTINQEISQKTGQLSSAYSYDAYGLGGMDISGGYGSKSEVKYKVNDTSKQVVDSIWDAIQ
jgi:hypothetical protein